MTFIPVVINGQSVPPHMSIVSCKPTRQMSVLLLGSSHVRHFDTYIRSHDKTNLTLDFSQTHIMCLGKSGLCALHNERDKKLSGQMSHVETLVPDVLILHVGSNDMSTDQKAVTVIVNEIFIQAHLALSLGVKHVVISQQFKRDEGDNFNDRVVQYNILCSFKCAQDPHMTFWHHNGLWQPENGVKSVLKADGVHLNEAGNEKFFKSMKELAIYAKNHFM